MPRRTPREIRSQLPLRDTRYDGRTVIPGLSASANRRIATFERGRGLPRGEVALTLRRWTLRAGHPHSADDSHYGYADGPTGHIRTLLEVAAWNLRSRGAAGAASRPGPRRRPHPRQNGQRPLRPAASALVATAHRSLVP